MTEFDQVKDSGERRDFGTGSVRDVRTGKGRFDLLEPYAIGRIAKHFENGAVKYGDSNWAKGQPLSVYLDSALRHLFNVSAGKTDEDHLSAACWNILCLISTQEWVRQGTLPAELDDIDWDIDLELDPAAPRWETELEDLRSDRAVLVAKVKRLEMEALLPQFVADAIITTDPHILRRDDEAQPKQTLIDQFASAVATEEPVVVLSGDIASLFQLLIEEGKLDPLSRELKPLVMDLLEAINDVDSDKQDSVGSDRPTSTDQTGGNNVR